jgi:hypothetical protein
VSSPPAWRSPSLSSSSIAAGTCCWSRPFRRTLRIVPTPGRSCVCRMSAGEPRSWMPWTKECAFSTTTGA